MSDNSKNLSSTKDLKRVLGFWDLMAVGIGSIIGSGIMSLTGWGIDETGRSVCIAFVIGGIIAVLARSPQIDPLLGNAHGRGVHARRGSWLRRAALLCFAGGAAASARPPRRRVLSEYFRAQAVRRHVCRHLRAALRARCAVAQARAGRGAAEK